MSRCDLRSAIAAHRRFWIRDVVAKCRWRWGQGDQTRRQCQPHGHTLAALLLSSIRCGSLPICSVLQVQESVASPAADLRSSVYHVVETDMCSVKKLTPNRTTAYRQLRSSAIGQAGWRKFTMDGGAVSGWTIQEECSAQRLHPIFETGKP